jgi:hypothetical protein
MNQRTTRILGRSDEKMTREGYASSLGERSTSNQSGKSSYSIYIFPVSGLKMEILKYKYGQGLPHMNITVTQQHHNVHSHFAHSHLLQYLISPIPTSPPAGDTGMDSFIAVAR